MKLFSPLRIRVEKDVITRIHRKLEGKGSINVSKDQQVSPEDLIGTANISSGYRKLNLANLLSVPPQDVQKYLKRTLGQRIYKDELLAYKNTFLGGKKIVVSPTDGILDFINPKTGELKMTFLPKKMDLPAGVYGIVDEVDKEKGQVIIRTQVSVVHGMFGSGRMRDGILNIVVKRDELLRGPFISPKHEGQILVCGSLVFKDAITNAISSGVSGFITGGINAKDYKGMAGGKLIFPKKLENDIGISIVVCEGFGSIPIGEDIYEMLAKYNGKFVSMDGNAGIINLPSFESNSIVRVRNTKLPPSQSMSLVSLDNRTLELKKGLKVRIIGNSFPGQQGTILALDETETVLPSGIKSFIATIETRKRKIQVPVANLEVIL